MDRPTPPGDADPAGPAVPAPGPPSGTRAGGGPPPPGGPPTPPGVSLPKGGGAVRDIGEKFTVTAATGTASMAVPVVTSPGRAGFGPSLSLTYDSGAGNGPFGLGWRTSLPAITRKTDLGLPRYLDDADQDTFILSGAEDLVPVRVDHDGVWQQVPERRTEGGRIYWIQRYQPRIEGLFARIERWRDAASGQSHWRTVTSDNVTVVYGATPASRIADPAAPERVFSWLICASYDDKGNAVAYDYVPEDSSGVDTSLASERNRTGRSRSAGRYLKRIQYGNRRPRSFLDDLVPVPAAGDWMFEVVFDYGDHDDDAPTSEPARSWPCRPDPFSTRRPGFEVRTYRRCHRILMFHHFPAEPDVGAGCLVSSTDLSYTGTGSGGMTTLASVTYTGYRGLRGGGYRKQSLPPLEFRYSRPVIGRKACDLSPEALASLPAGIGDGAYQWVDLDGEGLSGILARQGGAWFYQANRGDGRFAPARLLVTQPAAGSESRRQLLDLTGDGHLDLAELGGPAPGFYERTSDRGWHAFRRFRSWPGIPFDDPYLRLVDLDGDGLADVLVTGDDAFTWYPSLGAEGFGPGSRTFPPRDEERGPLLVFADPEQTIYLADMTGDGLTDLVRVRDGEVCYWPSTGFGRFGAKVIMDRSPWLDEPGQFDQRRVRLADVDGSGTTDLVYLHRERARIYFNQSGNGFSQAHGLSQGFPALDSLAQVMVADLLGRGTACLVWSSPLPSAAGRQIRYLDLMAEGKPYLLIRVINNLGAETRVSYAPSTRFYLADAAAGRPWITRLPFPVQVVERVETIDRINRNRYTTRYSYHHGYYDGVEREFRGFAMVESYDTEELAVLAAAGADRTSAALDPATDVPPVLTRTWMHTGIYPDQGRVSRMFADEYYQPPGGGPGLPDTVLPDTLRLPGQPPRPWRLSPAEARDACRALKGQPLREEVYALDGTEAQHRPYSVTEHNYTIELLQPGLPPRPDGPQNYHAVFLAHARETITAHYERALYAVDSDPRADPRITHDVVLAVDDYGHPLRSASASYGRRYPDPALPADDQKAQGRLLLTYAENAYTNAVDQPDAYRTPVLCESRTSEIVGLHPDDGARFSFGELRDGLAAIRVELPYQDWNVDSAGLTGPARRLIEHTRVRFRRDDLTGVLPLGALEPLALPYRSYRLAFTGSLLDALYGGRVSHRMLTEAGYVRDGDTQWIPSGTASYSPGDGDGATEELGFARRHFFLPRRFRDPFGNATTVGYDGYDLLVNQVRDPLGNLVTAGPRDRDDQLTAVALDYRVLAPRLVSDPNRNQVAAAFDALGRVAGTAVMGKPEERLGDSLDGFDPDPAPAAVAAYFADPFARAHDLLGRATTRLLYDLDAYQRSREEPYPSPAAVAALARETHDSDLAPGERTKIQRSFSYSDGFGREVQQKGQAPPGPVEQDGSAVERRWTGRRWTVFDSKGRPIREYEPFFSTSPVFEFARATGVSAVLFYDPPGRVVATLNPDHTYAKGVFGPWSQATWDANDTVLLDPRGDPDVRGWAYRYFTSLGLEPGGWATWYERRADGQFGPAQQQAARQTTMHAGTPEVAWLDAAGRTFLTVAHNRVPRRGESADEYYRSRSVRDVEGNLREVRDALDRAAMRYDYVISGDQVTRAGTDTGGTVRLPDVAGQPIRVWDARGFEFRAEYDPLRRPVRGYVRGPGITGDALQVRTVYGEALAGDDQDGDAQARNLRTRVAVGYDDAGVGTDVAYDFKGNLLETRRRLAAGYRDITDWDGRVDLIEPEYVARTSYDALNRPVRSTTPDGSVTIPAYDAAGLPDRVDIVLHGDTEATAFVTRLEYDARGQRTVIDYGNGTRSEYAYDPLTFRLAGLVTLRGSQRLQDLRYACDPVGNPVSVHDQAQQRVFFRNQVVEPSVGYVYDAIYRLVEASGREHLGQTADSPPHTVPPSSDDVPRIGLPQPGDGAAMARYFERYSYDAAGNLLRMAHRPADPAHGGWTRDYHYTEPSLLQPDRPGNRLSGTSRSRDPREHRTFGYDEQGNITAMPEIPVLRWDPLGRLHMTARNPAAAGETQPSYYVYDAAGQRVRKVTEGTSERVYLGPYEIYHEYGTGGEVTLTCETLHVFAGQDRAALVETCTAGPRAGPLRLVRYQLTNHLGSSVLELDQHAQVISYEEYYPYGATSYQAVRAQTETPKRCRYTGQERDLETGLYYYGARYYVTWLGRWASCDPAGLADGLNMYAFVRDDPAGRTDPDGRVATRWFVAAIGGAITLAGVAVASGVSGGTVATVGAAVAVIGGAYAWFAGPFTPKEHEEFLETDLESTYPGRVLRQTTFKVKGPGTGKPVIIRPDTTVQLPYVAGMLITPAKTGLAWAFQIFEAKYSETPEGREKLRDLAKSLKGTLTAGQLKVFNWIIEGKVKWAEVRTSASQFFGQRISFLREIKVAVPQEWSRKPIHRKYSK
jgi:RHS repeat-associated protein